MGREEEQDKYKERLRISFYGHQSGDQAGISRWYFPTGHWFNQLYLPRIGSENWFNDFAASVSITRGDAPFLIQDRMPWFLGNSTERNPSESTERAGL